MVNILHGLEADSRYKDGAPLLSTVWTTIFNLFSKIGFESKTPKSVNSFAQILVCTYLKPYCQLVDWRSGRVSLVQGFAHLPRTDWQKILFAPPINSFFLGGQQLPELVCDWEAASQSWGQATVLYSAVAGGVWPHLPLCSQGFQLMREKLSLLGQLWSEDCCPFLDFHLPADAFLLTLSCCLLIVLEAWFYRKIEHCRIKCSLTKLRQTLLR